MTIVAVIAGGPSSEAAVSHASAKAVCQALTEAGDTPYVIELDAQLPNTLTDLGAEVAFPVAHGPVGEDGCLQGLLEVLNVPYVGSGVRASAVAASKPDAKVHFRAAGLPVARECVVQRGESLTSRARQLREELGPAVVVKPASGGSGIGVARIGASDNDEALVRALHGALVEGAALVEAMIEGHEVTCGVLEVDNEPRALPPTLIHSRAADWYDFASRYAPGGSVHECPAPFSAELTERIQRVAIAGFTALGGRDLGRLDFVVEPHGDLTLLELNTLPGMTATSLFPEAAAVAGFPFPQLCHHLVERALARPLRSTPEIVPIPE